MITHKELIEIIDYNENNGQFVWRKKIGSRACVGVIAGSRHRFGYINIHIHKKEYKAHRLAWLYVHGDWPSGEVDHINGRRDDNRIVNLRDVSMRENRRNKAIQRDNMLGIKGVRRIGKKYQARITKNGKSLTLGTFDTAEEAGAVYMVAARFLFGDFARDEKYIENRI